MRCLDLPCWYGVGESCKLKVRFDYVFGARKTHSFIMLQIQVPSLKSDSRRAQVTICAAFKASASVLVSVNSSYNQRRLACQNIRVASEIVWSTKGDLPNPLWPLALPHWHMGRITRRQAQNCTYPWKCAYSAHRRRDGIDLSMLEIQRDYWRSGDSTRCLGTLKMCLQTLGDEL